MKASEATDKRDCHEKVWCGLKQMKEAVALRNWALETLTVIPALAGIQ
jgi:hypothetical protein